MATYFSPACTLPSTAVNYVASPNVRGTLDILFTSLATIIACTYNVLHMNVPKQRQGQDRGFMGDVKWGARRFGYNLKWTVITILAPEFYFSLSVHQWFIARSDLKQLHKAVPVTKKTHTMSHMYFANMGGFVLEYDDSPPDSSDATGLDSPKGYRTEADATGDTRRLLGGHDVEDGRGASTDTGHELENTPSEGKRHSSSKKISQKRVRPPKVWHLRGQNLRKCIEDGSLPAKIISEDAINDKSKSDSFAKALTMIQIIYYSAEVLSRAIYRLPVSQLEIGVTGFVICSVCTYAFTFAKCKSACEAIVLKSYDGDLPEQIREACRISDTEEIRLGKPAKMDEAWDLHINSVYSISLIAGTIFGAVHLLAWNFEFPTRVDSWIWRAAAISSTAMPILFWPIHILIMTVFPDTSGDGWFAAGVIIVQLGLYIVSRIMIMVEMFRCLFYLPPGAFNGTAWVLSIPHVG